MSVSIALRRTRGGVRFFSDNDLVDLRTHACKFFATDKVQQYALDRIDDALSRYAWLSGTKEKGIGKTINARKLALEQLWKACENVTRSGLEPPASMLSWV